MSKVVGSILIWSCPFWNCNLNFSSSASETMSNFICIQLRLLVFFAKSLTLTDNTCIGHRQQCSRQVRLVM